MSDTSTNQPQQGNLSQGMDQGGGQQQTTTPPTETAGEVVQQSGQQPNDIRVISNQVPSQVASGFPGSQTDGGVSNGINEIQSVMAAGGAEAAQNAGAPAQASASEPVSGGSVERVEFGPRTNEVTPMVEASAEDHELEPEVEGWLEKLEKGEDIKLPQPVYDDQGTVILDNAQEDNVEEKIVLPLTEEQMEVNLKAKVSTSARWLAEWCKKLLKQMGDGTVFKQS